MQSFVPLLAEVSDKIVTLNEMWTETALFSVGAMIVSACHRRAALVTLPVAALWELAVISEIRDPHVGPAILKELGQGYVTQSYVAAVVPFALVAVGYWINRTLATYCNPSSTTKGT